MPRVDCADSIELARLQRLASRHRFPIQGKARQGLQARRGPPSTRVPPLRLAAWQDHQAPQESHPNHRRWIRFDILTSVESIAEVSPGLYRTLYPDSL